MTIKTDAHADDFRETIDLPSGMKLALVDGKVVIHDVGPYTCFERGEPLRKRGEPWLLRGDVEFLRRAAVEKIRRMFLRRLARQVPSTPR